MPDPSQFVLGLRDAAQAAAVGLYALCQLTLTLYAAQRYAILIGRRRESPRGRARPTIAADRALPVVTVQLPVYDEPRVVQRLVDAAAALDWPADRLEIQLLDDSTDGTTALAAAAIARHRARGVDIVHVRRPSRDGFKAGALAHGLRAARGTLIAVFDSDFVPPPDFLRRVVPRFADRSVGMVQARWGHLNRTRSALTTAQAVLLDAHFLLEHAARMRGGLFFNFNGTAGVWRRRCIEDAGGWSHDTLTEDLDLSYRAQLAGWRFAFAPDVVVPAELPADMGAFKTQQRRWAKGSVQTARKILPGLWRTTLPWRVKVEATVHLTSNFVYPLLLALGLLLLPVLLGRSTLPPALLWTLHAAVLFLGVLPVGLFLAAGQRAAGMRWRDVLVSVPAAFLLGAGLSLNNARAVLEGLGPRVGEWERTPKTGDATPAAGPRSPRPAGVRDRAALRGAGMGELALAGYFALLFAWGLGVGQARALPFLALLTCGFAWVGNASRAPGVRGPAGPSWAWGRGAPRYSRTILAERLPWSALRVSTTDFE